MPARPRQPARRSTSPRVNTRLHSTVSRRPLPSKEVTPPPPQISSSVHSNTENHRTNIRSPRYQERAGSNQRKRPSPVRRLSPRRQSPVRRSSPRRPSPVRRRTRSPPRNNPPLKRRVTPPSKRENHDVRSGEKRIRETPRQRSKSRERRPYADTKEKSWMKQQRNDVRAPNVEERDTYNDRYRGSVTGPQFDLKDRKENKVDIRKHGEDKEFGRWHGDVSLHVPRKPAFDVTGRGGRDFTVLDNGTLNRSHKMDSLPPPAWPMPLSGYPPSRGISHKEPHYRSEGARSVIPREDVQSNFRYDENEIESRRAFVAYIEADRKRNESYSRLDPFRRDPFYERERGRDFASPRALPPREFEKYRDERPREEPRFPYSVPRGRTPERFRDYPVDDRREHFEDRRERVDDRRERFDDRREHFDDRDGVRPARRSPDRGRIDRTRRHPSPIDRKRSIEHPVPEERRARSYERRGSNNLRDFRDEQNLRSSDFGPRRVVEQEDSRDNSLSQGQRDRGRGPGPNFKNFSRPAPYPTSPVTSPRSFAPVAPARRYPVGAPSKSLRENYGNRR